MATHIAANFGFGGLFCLQYWEKVLSKKETVSYLSTNKG